MQKSLTPFGIRYQGNSVVIKLRLHPVKFGSSPLSKYGSYRTTNNGYVIFETTVDRNSNEFSEIQYCLNALKNWPKLAKPKPAE